MSKKQECIGHLCNAGFTYDDAWRLRRDAMTLHRWAERECNGEVERDDDTGKVYASYDYGTGGRKRFPARDLETPAIARIKEVMSRYPEFVEYIQGDPRGAPLYIVRKADIPEGKELDAYYSRGIAVYK